MCVRWHGFARHLDSGGRSSPEWRAQRDMMDPDLPPNRPQVLPAEESPADPQPWGFWATLGWAIVIGIGYTVVQMIAVFLFILTQGGMDFVREQSLQQLLSNGKLVAIATLASAPVVVGLCILAAWLKRSLTVKEYFALRWPPARVTLKWLAVFVPFLLIVNVSLSLIKGEATEQFMSDVTKSAGWATPLLWLAIFVGAPVSEEFFFRGFLFAGLKNTWMGVTGAVIVPTLLFTAIHLQYDLQGLLFVLLAGLFFGVARAKTDSLWLPICLHAFMNVVATIGHTFMSE